jgi:hypothetical protein
MKVEKGLRLGASNYNVCEFPSKREQAANYSHDTLRQSGVVVLINGIPTIKQQAIADYAAAATKFYGKPVLVVVNDEERFIDSPLSGVPGANVLRSVGNSIAGLRNADWGAAREASVLRSAYVIEKVNNHYTKANGMALADEFVKSVATAQFADRVYDSLLSLMPKLYHYRDPESVPVKERANYQDFVLAFRDRLAVHRTAGNLGRYEIPEGLREALGIAK